MSKFAPSDAVIICTRNRAADLERTLHSIAATAKRPEMLTLIVDASNEDAARANRNAVRRVEPLSVHYFPYRGSPSGTRQRNYGVDCLPPSVNVVHFIDDDVVVLPGYFRRLAQTLNHHPNAGGVGGFIMEDHGSKSARRAPLLQRLFLLSSSEPGRVLPSGHTSSISSGSRPQCVEWLSSCASSYRRAVFDEYRFDPSVEGRSPRLEDLDFSYRVGQSWKLLAEPRARLIHYSSATNRRTTEDFAAESLPRRYWFVEKNIHHPLRKPAFWWATLGRLLAVFTSPKPRKWNVLRGLFRGIRDVWQRNHPLLRRPQ